MQPNRNTNLQEAAHRLVLSRGPHDARSQAPGDRPAQMIMASTGPDPFLALALVAEGLEAGGDTWLPSRRFVMPGARSGELLTDPRFPSPESPASPVPQAPDALYS